jgi:hypothetical protein
MSWNNKEENDESLLSDKEFKNAWSYTTKPRAFLWRGI